MSNEQNPFAHLIVPKKGTEILAEHESKSVQANPLTSLLAPSAPTQPLAGATVKDEISSQYQLAGIDTTSLTPATQPKTQLASKVEARTEQLILESGKSVRELCDQVDHVMAEDKQLSMADYATIRGYVMQLMITLKSRPEFESLLIDKDVRNVMRFLRATREEAMALRDVKTEKKATRGVKKERTTKIGSDMKDAFNEVFGAIGLLKK